MAKPQRSEGPNHRRRGQSEAPPPVSVEKSPRAESASQKKRFAFVFGLPVPGEEIQSWSDSHCQLPLRALYTTHMSGGGGIRGRGAAGNPTNRFEKITLEPSPDEGLEEGAAPQTRVFRDVSQSIIAYNESPDVGFAAGINVYRGCEHAI